jgi:hypothetical protein
MKSWPLHDSPAIRAAREFSARLRKILPPVDPVP